MPGSNKTPRIRLRLSSSSHAKEVSPPSLLAASNSLQPTTDDEALKTENEKLKAENAALKMQVDALLHQKQTLVQALSDATNTTTTISNKKRKANDDTTTNGPPAPKKARTPAQRRKLFEKWAKSAIRESAKVKLTTYDCRKTFLAVVKETTPWSKNEFEALFCGDGGTKIQPTPENKPQVTILRFDSYERVQALFRGVEIPRTGYKAKAMKKPLFDACYKAGVWDATLHGLEVHYNKAKCTLQLQFVLVSGNCYHE